MVYQRPQSKQRLSPEEKKQLLKDYSEFYRVQAQIDIQNLNKKIPREAFEAFLDEIGCKLLEASAEMAKSNLDIQNFLADTPLPLELQILLPDEFRVFCLLLNALKQWISAEQQATDRYLLGGTARKALRSVTDHCLVTGKEIGGDGELHHPVRDGRPPILLSKEGHSIIVGQVKKPKALIIQSKDLIETPMKGNSIETTEIIKSIKKNGHNSWIQLRNACQEHLGNPVTFTTPNVRSTSRSFAKKVRSETGLSSQQLLDWLNENEL